MFISSLKVLHDHQEDLLLAEMAALLHDVGKFCDLHIESHTGGIRRWGNGGSYKAIVNDPRSLLRPSQSNNWIRNNLGVRLLQVLQNRQPTFYSEFDRLTSRGANLETSLNSFYVDIAHLDRFSVAEIIILGIPGAAQPINIQSCFARNGWLPSALGIAHSVAHHDKQDGDGPQSWPDVFSSSAFGFETPLKDLDILLQKFPVPCNPEQIQNYIIQNFVHGLGDTRRPVNEVTLLDWVWTVASLYKSSVAHALLQNPQPIVNKDNNDLRWRLLRVNFDVLGLYAKAVKIGDLLGYQRVVDEACEAIKQLIEEEYPLGNEIYRDHTGIYFTFPDLDLPADLAQEIRRRVDDVEIELAPHIAVVRGDGNTAAEQLKGILGKARREALKDLAQPFDTQNLSADWEKKWAEALAQEEDKGKWETCPVCGLRPKREDRDVCQTCEDRRKGRVRDWLNNPSTTIWTNEVADKNRRLALIVGEFGLDDWLSGDLVQTMLVKADPDTNTFTPKNPSPARLRRVWETTQRFWDGVLEEKNAKGKPIIQQDLSRFVLEGRLSSNNALNTGQAYDLHVHGFKLSVVWDGARFLVCDNSAYFKETTKEDLQSVLKPGASFTLTTSEGYKKQDREIGRFTIDKVDDHPTPYAPVIPILAEPQIFMALVPADKALDVARAIKAKYEREMGKVRNRLPLHLGLVFAGRRIPLQAILDAGRAMLTIPTEKLNNETWCVEKVDPTPSLPAELKEGTKQFDKMPITLTLKNAAGRTLTWHVPTVMGDGKTPDQWYPYVFLKTDAEPVNHSRRFQARNPWTGSEGWLVHAGDLKEGDEIYFTPATFDFEYLDSTARRFDIYYNNEGRRPRPTRPYYLDDLDRLKKVWNACRALKRSQFSQMLQTIETARERWDIPLGEKAEEDGVFWQFVADTLTNANWPKGTKTQPAVIARGEATKQSPPVQQKIASPTPSGDCFTPARFAMTFPDDMQALITAAVRGELADLAELHLEILKENMKGETA